jgi:hypothetical protein
MHDERLAKRDTESPEAYELYLKGRYCWNHSTSDRLNQSIRYFNEALTSDPGFVLAYTGLADTRQLPKENFAHKDKAACAECDDNRRESETNEPGHGAYSSCESWSVWLRWSH